MIYVFKQLVYKKLVIDWEKNLETLVCCSGYVKKLYNTKFSRKSTWTCFLLLICTISVWKRFQLVILICLDIFRDNERLYPPRSVPLSSNKARFGLENKKLIEKL